MNLEQWTFVVAAASMVAAAVAAYQVKYARQALRFSERVQREASEPYVIVSIRPLQPWVPVLVVAIENTGPTVARNIRIAVSPDIESSLGDEMTQQLRQALARTIPMLPPGQKLEYPLDGEERWSSGLPMLYTFTVNAEGPHGPLETMRYVSDISVLGTSLVGERPLKKVENELGQLRKLVKKLADGYVDANHDAILESKRRRQESSLVLAQRLARQLQAHADPAPAATSADGGDE
ncbi:hypothetical protein ACFW9D_05680 [Streptomyces sp. NPDC059524]|uniref:hypothetical protein n=1 Tax=Streptomyces sp. NPDC059524 TaxID=3346856 RepID=UPI0036A29353